jgi:hypothetical protein
MQDLGHWTAGDWMLLPESEIALPGVIVGASGSGKTETELRIAYGAASCYRWQVVFVDGKGDHATAARFLAAMRQAGVSLARLKMFPAAAFNGWNGDGQALLNRLMEVVDHTEPYYESVAQVVLSLALKAPTIGLPSSSQDLLRRLNVGVLTSLYQQHPLELTKLQGLHAKEAMGVIYRYDGFFGALDGKLDGAWSYEDVDAAYLLLDGLALKNEAARLGRYLVEDFASYVVKRKPRDRRTLLIIDEYSALRMKTSAVNLAERLRSYGATVIVSAQSYEGLGRDDEAQRLLGAANFLILHRTNNPFKLSSRAGMEQRTETRWSLDLARPTSYGTASVRPRYKIEPEQVMGLHNGEAFVISRGERLKIRVAQIAVSAQEMATSEAFIQQEEQADQQRQQVVGGVLPPLPQVSVQKARPAPVKKQTKKGGNAP